MDACLRHAQRAHNVAVLTTWPIPVPSQPRRPFLKIDALREVPARPAAQQEAAEAEFQAAQGSWLRCVDVNYCAYGADEPKKPTTIFTNLPAGSFAGRRCAHGSCLVPAGQAHATVCKSAKAEDRAVWPQAMVVALLQATADSAQQAGQPQPQQAQQPTQPPPAALNGLQGASVQELLADLDGEARLQAVLGELHRRVGHDAPPDARGAAAGALLACAAPLRLLLDARNGFQGAALGVLTSIGAARVGGSADAVRALMGVVSQPGAAGRALAGAMALLHECCGEAGGASARAAMAGDLAFLQALVACVQGAGAAQDAAVLLLAALLAQAGPGGGAPAPAPVLDALLRTLPELPAALGARQAAGAPAGVRKAARQIEEACAGLLLGEQLGAIDLGGR
jgi:hypothetical protein